MTDHKRGLKLTTMAVETQTDLMGCDVFDIGMFDRANDRMLRREWDREQLLTSIAYLRMMNREGRDIYVRPAVLSPIVLIDDLTASGITALLLDDPTVLFYVETSPGSFQAWVHYYHSRTGFEQLNLYAIHLASTYGGDVHAANYRQYGRLAGFTNNKPKHTKADGRQPFVLLHRAPKLALAR